MELSTSSIGFPISFSNIGANTATITALSTSDLTHFAITDGNCSSSSLGAGTDCYAHVEFTPTSIASVEAFLNITYSISGQPNNTMSIPIKGIGISAGTPIGAYVVADHDQLSFTVLDETQRIFLRNLSAGFQIGSSSLSTISGGTTFTKALHCTNSGPPELTGDSIVPLSDPRLDCYIDVTYSFLNSNPINESLSISYTVGGISKSFSIPVRSKCTN